MHKWVRVTRDKAGAALLDPRKITRIVENPRGSGTTVLYDNGETDVIKEGLSFFEGQEGAALPLAEAPAAGVVPLALNARYYIEGTTLHVLADISPEALAKAPMSHGRKNRLVASSKGNPEVEGSPIEGLRIAFNLYAPIGSGA